MKTLYLIRHAKSSWETANLTDFDRPLNERGKKNAPEMGKFLKKENHYPDLILSSPAKRALKTARIIAEEIGYPKNKIEEEIKIYEASVSDLLKITNQLDEKLNTVFLFGHNPGFTDFLNYLTDESISNIPTCGIAKIEFEVDSWKKISGGTGKLVYFNSPKKH